MSPSASPCLTNRSVLVTLQAVVVLLCCVVSTLPSGRSHAHICTHMACIYSPHLPRALPPCLPAHCKGMQRNPGVITIEELLLKALLDADAISQENFEQPQSMAFQRTARTDKGVHAAGEITCAVHRESSSSSSSSSPPLSQPASFCHMLTCAHYR